MATTNLPITVKRGDTEKHTFSWVSGADVSLWTSLELAVTSIEEPPDATTLLEAMTGTPLVGEANKVYFNPLGTLDPGDYYYDAQGINPEGEKKTFAEGTYVVTQDRGKS